MTKTSRRAFLRKATQLGIALPLAAVPLDAETQAALPECIERVSLNGIWQFRLDPEKTGESQNWHLMGTLPQGWTDVTVPHTWQITPDWADYLGVAWYRRSFFAAGEWANGAVRVEFEAVFHSATVWVNGEPLGKHLGKGYTAFTLDITRSLRYGEANIIAVKVDNAFNEAMLPRGGSSDWANDGGIYRPVSLLVTPKAFIERVDVDALPDIAQKKATLEITVVVQNLGNSALQGYIGYRVVEEDTGQIVFQQNQASAVDVKPGASWTAALPAATLESPKLWHFDHPHLYRLETELDSDGRKNHASAVTFGVRSIEVSNGGFYLNGQRVFLMGVERMGGSHPDYGAAEPAQLLIHDHNDLKELNTVFTRVHWQQDQRVLDYCDRHGILIQVEVPTWGPKTFQGMNDEPSAEIMQNGLEQLREMIQRDRNHPSIFAWGLCNEINGQNPPAYKFAKRLYEEARKLDPRRLRSYASNSLQKTPERDVSGLMDFIEWNEYYESWYKGTVEDLRRNLEEIHRAFPDKMIVISEYGYCACTPERPEDDERRIEILREHNKVFRENSYVGGLIYFCYNDYRTHIGDKGIGVLKQRVHGVVDLYGARKPSFEVLRNESSPVASLAMKGEIGSLSAVLRTRKQIPAYTLSGYKLRWIVYGSSALPLEKHEVELPQLEPGREAIIPVRFEENKLSRMRIDVLRPTGFSAFTAEWKP